MNNTQKDRYENKLARFIKAWDKAWDEVKKANGGIVGFDSWEKKRDELQKEFGFTETDMQRAYALHRHHSDRHFWCDNQFHKGEQKQRVIDKAERRLKRPDEQLEAEMKEEDRLFGDMSDEHLCYCDFLEMKDK